MTVTPSTATPASPVSVVSTAIERRRDRVDVLLGLGPETGELRGPDKPLAVTEVVVHGAVGDTDPVADIGDPDAGLALGLEHPDGLGDERVDLREGPRLLSSAPRWPSRKEVCAGHPTIMPDVDGRHVWHVA